MGFEYLRDALQWLYKFTHERLGSIVYCNDTSCIRAIHYVTYHSKKEGDMEAVEGWSIEYYGPDANSVAEELKNRIVEIKQYYDQWQSKLKLFRSMKADMKEVSDALAKLETSLTSLLTKIEHYSRVLDDLTGHKLIDRVFETAWCKVSKACDTG